MSDIANWLNQNSIFSHLQVDDRILLAQEAVSRNYFRGERITHLGDIWPYIFLVENGKVTAVKESAEGRSLIIVSITPGEIFWGAAFFKKNAPMLAALVADEDSRIHLWSRERMIPILIDNGRVSWEIACLMVNRMQRASDIVDELAFQTVAARLAGFLVTHFHDDEFDRVSRNLTLDEMAARIGTTREMVSRILHRFSDQGFIEITRTEFMFKNWDELIQISQKE